MSQTKVQLVSNIVGNVSGGASFTGIVTAPAFNGNITGVAATFTGNVSIAGTLSYEDVTNVDSVGLVTARTGVRITDGGLVVTAGVSTFTSGPVFIGSGTSTGTTSQTLQVTGGAYVSGNLGIGTTNPQATLQVGTAISMFGSTGIISATSFRGDGSQLTGISSVSFATTSFGLSGTPSILVSSVGINTTTTNNTKLYLQGNAAGNIVGLGSTTATTTLDFSQGNNFSLILGATITIANPTGVTTGQSGVILIQEDATGGYTCAWGTSWDFASSTAPTLTTTANALNALPYFARSTTSIVVGSVIAGIGTL